MASNYLSSYYTTKEKTKLVHTGRGGAGNYTRVSLASTPRANGPPNTLTRINSNTPSISSISTAASYASSTNTFSSGRGGAGNIHPLSEYPTISESEEKERAELVSKRREARNIWFIGRGGAGNEVIQEKRDDEKNEDGIHRSGSLERMWRKIGGR
ncbi:MAG: hypothetical protein M1834_001317 [Cirrosporium novae-zelandiae]|nr:MAG: hypothetical protein M1834_001317 [Cirrosporium novae-zelandiae]